MTFVKGKSGNPAGRPKRAIQDLSREARKYAGLALSTLVKICRDGQDRNRLTAATALLDRGYGRPLTTLDLVTAGKKLNEMTSEELKNFEARLVSNAADDAQADMFSDGTVH